jgi:phosphate transport system permease protein
MKEIALGEPRKKRVDPVSVAISIFVHLAIVLTVGVLLFIVGYILVRGIPYIRPSLFSLTYTTENVSLFPAIVTTLYMVLLALVIAAPFGIFCAVYLVEYARKSNRFIRVIRLATETLSASRPLFTGFFGHFVLYGSEVEILRSLPARLRWGS